MAHDVDTTLRGPEAYAQSRRAIEAMEAHGVWPTPLNFELWLHYVCDPQGAIAREIDRLLSSGETFTEAVTEELASTYLPKARLNEEIRDAGDQLSRELAAVSKAIDSASKSSQAYGATLESVSRDLAPADGKAPPLRRIVQTLTTATRQIQTENRSLEVQLRDSTAEVTRLRVHLEQVRRDATTDALTNLANRKAFDEELARACAEAEATKKPLALAVVDIDHFKGFNDTWGHQTGDQVIRYVASVLSRVASPPRLAARYGGEEFGVIFPGEFGAGVERLMDELRAEVCSRSLKRRSTNDDLGAVTISIGLAERRPGEAAACFLERADEALYASKRGGRNRVTSAKAMEKDAKAA